VMRDRRAFEWAREKAWPGFGCDEVAVAEWKALGARTATSRRSPCDAPLAHSALPATAWCSAPLARPCRGLRVTALAPLPAPAGPSGTTR